MILKDIPRVFRSVLFWVHLAAGVCAAGVIVIMSLSGVLLTYQRQITWLADTRGMTAAPVTGAEAVTPEFLIEQVGDTYGAPTGLRYRSAADAPVEVLYGRELPVYVNAYSGEFLGRGAAGVRRFFGAVTDWHRWLALSGEARRTGRAVTGAANLMFLFMLLSGLYLWWPRTRAFGNVMLFRRGLRPKARDFNWHNVIGFWSAVPLLVIVSSGVVISYGWAANLVSRLGSAPASAPAVGTAAGYPAVSAVAEASASPGRAPDGQREARSLQFLLERAKQKDPAWRILTLQLPPRAGAYTIVLDRGDGGQPHKRAELTLSAAGEELRWEPFASRSADRRVRSILQFVHTGEVLGVPGQTVAGLVSAGALVLVWTGLALALRRLSGWVGRRLQRSTGMLEKRRRRDGAAAL